MDRANGIHDFAGMGQIGATGLNWDFSDEELSVLGYLSNSLPRKQAPLVYELRRFIDGMDMIGVPSSVPRRISMRGPLRRIARSEQLVRELGRFLRENGVHERLKVIEGPEGEPSLYFGHRRPIPFELACSSDTMARALLPVDVVEGAERGRCQSGRRPSVRDVAKDRRKSHWLPLHRRRNGSPFKRGEFLSSNHM